MARQPNFGREKIREQFEDIAECVDRETVVYLIGGGAMTLSGQKDATKDVDVVVESKEAYDRIRGGLVEFGYEPQEDLKEEYKELGAAVVLEKDNRRFDVFDRQVAGELMLTDGIRSRSSAVIEDNPLYVRRFSDEDVFLFKSVANRPDDLDDMAVLLGGGLDFEVVLDELVRQVEVVERDEFVTSVDRKLKRLEDERGIRTDLSDPVGELNEVSRIAGEIRTLPEISEGEGDLEGMSIRRLETVTEYSKEEVEEAIDWLEKMGSVRRRGTRVILTEDT